MQQSRHLQGTLSTAYDHHALAGKLTESKMISGMRHKFNRHMSKFRRAVGIVAKPRCHHDGLALHYATINEGQFILLFAAFNIGDKGFVNIWNGLSLKPQPVVNECLN